MSRAQRIDIAGYYHILDRGVEQRDVFINPKDFEKFLNILNTVSLKFNVTLHAYCLMNNHYHLLIETKDNRLSYFMKLINSQYAIYFNKRYKRVGHLWQGRFKSWYVTDERYLYTLIKYIEYNPLKAKIIKNLGEYPYSSYQSLIGEAKPLPCMNNSLMMRDYSFNEVKEFFTLDYNPQELEEINKSSSLVVSSLKKEEPDIQSMIFDFNNYETKKERNELVHEYYKQGYSQHLMAKYLGLAQSSINKILNKKE